MSHSQKRDTDPQTLKSQWKSRSKTLTMPNVTGTIPTYTAKKQIDTTKNQKELS